MTKPFATLFCLVLCCGHALAQDLEDIPLQDSAVPSLAPTKTPTVAPTSKPTTKATFKPTIAPTVAPTVTKTPQPTPSPTRARAALPLPVASKPPTATPKPQPTAPPLEDAPIADTPLEDTPIADIPAPAVTSPKASGTPTKGGANSIEDAPLTDATPAPLPSGAETHAHDAAEPIHNDTLSDPNGFLWQAFYAGALVALMCGFLGLYVVTRRMVFIGVALAEISSAGIALALLVAPLLTGTALGFLAPHLNILGALVFMLLGVALLSVRWAPRGLPPDAPVGVFYLLASATGILMIAKSAQGEGHMLTLLRGDVLAVYPHETLQMAIVFAVLALIHALFSKEFLLVSLDRDSAATQGYNAARWDFLLLLTIGVAVSLSIRSVGVLLTTAMLVLPAATALLATPRWKIALVTAPLIGLVAVAIGIYLSLVGDFPASAVIVAVMFIFLAPMLVWRTLRR